MQSAQKKNASEMKQEMDGILDLETRDRFKAEVLKIGKVLGGPNGIITFEQFIAIQQMIARF
jgi:hypothetical protein